MNLCVRDEDSRFVLKMHLTFFKFVKDLETLICHCLTFFCEKLLSGWISKRAVYYKGIRYTHYEGKVRICSR
ncbi:hypothetical protein L1987_78307 [Smallanthus sonchifolius]|uniref:Uncharacterized protein n=1 Tax=Smallanthus sonchifolius TaxID=185202 RepID=A0ACB8ZC14_9ASTR|nr:hypothetical protein L1987_78307 [Smallanthus sonchifolius]